MDDKDTEAALLALADPLEWQQGRSGVGEEYDAELQTAGKRYHFSLMEVGCAGLTEESGAELPWLLTVCRSEATRNEWYVERVDFRSWVVPCATVAAGKAICERLVRTDDCAEVERLNQD